jgi:hypothetical protein
MTSTLTSLCLGDNPDQPRQRFPDAELAPLLFGEIVRRYPDQLRELLLRQTELRSYLFEFLRSHRLLYLRYKRLETRCQTDFLPGRRS